MKSVLASMAAAFVVSTILAADSGPESAPALCYKLAPGQEIVYESSYQFEHKNGTHHSEDVTTFWVAGVNDHGGWHVVARHESTFTQTFADPGRTTSPPEKDDQIGTFDLLPNGTVENLGDNPRSKALLGPLIVLPDDLAAAQKGWEDSQEPEEKQIYRLLPESEPRAGKWLFSRTQEGLFNTIYLSSSEAVIRFDSNRGLITGSDGTYAQDFGFHGKGTTKVALKSVGTKPKEWVAQLAEEASVLERVRKEVEETIKGHGSKLTGIQDAVKSALEKGRALVKLPMIQAQLDGELKNMAEYANSAAQSQSKADAVDNQPSPDWETTDLTGKKQRMADYRGKVVLLDFWYRGCGYCIKAMPQIKEVVEHYRGGPVAVLGMNTDKEAEDAQFVVDTLQLNYPTLKAAGLPEKYAVSGFPTLIIIDAGGVVRDREVGYSPTLREDLIKVIDGLIAGGK